MVWSQILSLNIFLPFIPLFVAFDVFGILPIFVFFTVEMTPAERRLVVRQSTATAFLVSIGFLAAGKFVFSVLGIAVSDFNIAGGILLFIIAIIDLIFPERTRTFPKETMGIVPIGIPLIAGPAVLALLLLLVDKYGYFSTILSLVLNLIIVWVVFSRSHLVLRVLKEGGAKGIGKISALLLAAFAMTMIRTGLKQWLGLFD
jgi:multiple antibiotic resistance protein